MLTFRSTEDERSIANRLANEERKEKEDEQDNTEAGLAKKDPTLPVGFLPIISIINYLRLCRQDHTVMNLRGAQRSMLRFRPRKRRS